MDMYDIKHEITHNLFAMTRTPKMLPHEGSKLKTINFITFEFYGNGKNFGSRINADLIRKTVCYARALVVTVHRQFWLKEIAAE